MPHIVADRVRETSTTAGTGSYTLAGAVAGFRAFSGALSASDTCTYAALDTATGGWEVGLGTLTNATTLARTAILSSSNSGGAVNWAAGTREVFITLAASVASVNVQEFSTPGTSTWTKPAGARLIHVVAHGGGGGGGSGRRRASGETAATGGGGGGSGGRRVEAWVLAASVTDAVTVTIGAGGTGGAARTTDGTNGASGTAGGETSFGSFVFAVGGMLGSAGSTTGGAEIGRAHV